MNKEKLLAALAAFTSKPDEAGVSVSVTVELLESSRASVNRHIKSGLLDSFKVGNSRRVTVGSIRRVCAAR